LKEKRKSGASWGDYILGLRCSFLKPFGQFKSLFFNGLNMDEKRDKCSTASYKTILTLFCKRGGVLATTLDCKYDSFDLLRCWPRNAPPNIV